MKVVLLHAFPLDERMWQSQREALAEHDVVAPNLYGLGGSSMNAWAQRLLGEVEGELALVGASMGGYAALAAARQHPERVRGVLLAGARPDADSPERRDGRAETIRLIEEQGAEGLWENQRSKLLAEEASESAVELARTMTLGRTEDELVRAIAAIRDRQDNSSLLTSLSVPIVFAQGAGDLFFPVDEARAFAEQLANGRLVVVERSRHLPNLEQPEDFNRILLEFLEKADEVAT